MKNFSYSQALLAIAIAALAWSLLTFTLHIPDILKTIDKTSHTVEVVIPKVDDIIDEVALVRIEVSKVRELISLQAPAILAQVESTLPVVNKVILESENYSRNLPTILKQIKSIENQVASIQKDLPLVLKRIDNILETTNVTTAEVARWRPHSTEYINEIKLSREYIPQYLTRIENTVTNAKTIGSDASSGLVSGFFKGVISLPFDVVAGLAGIVDVNSLSAKHLTAKDVAMMQEKVIGLLNDTKLNKSSWQNVESSNRGIILKETEITRKKQRCHKVTFTNYFGDKKETLEKLMCLNKKGLWKVI